MTLIKVNLTLSNAYLTLNKRHFAIGNANIALAKNEFTLAKDNFTLYRSQNIFQKETIAPCKRQNMPIKGFVTPGKAKHPVLPQPSLTITAKNIFPSFIISIKTGKYHCLKYKKMLPFPLMDINMDNDKQNIADPIDRLKKEIFQQKEKLSSIEELVKTQIDRDFHTNLWELSEKELDNEMGNRLSFLNDDIDPRPDPAAITSHRKILGKPIVFIKRIIIKIAGTFASALLEKQRRFNEQLVNFHLASFIRFRQNEKKLAEIQEKLKTFAEDQEMLLEELEKLKNDK